MTPRTAHPLDWLPSGRIVALRPAGEWWDAVRVPRAVGELVLTALGTSCGAVIEDPSGALLYFLVRPGDACSWSVPRASGVQVHGRAAHVVVPGAQRTAGPHWRVPPTRSRCLTDAGALREALTTAISATLKRDDLVPLTDKLIKAGCGHCSHRSAS